MIFYSRSAVRLGTIASRSDIGSSRKDSWWKYRLFHLLMPSFLRSVDFNHQDLSKHATRSIKFVQKRHMHWVSDILDRIYYKCGCLMLLTGVSDGEYFVIVKLYLLAPHGVSFAYMTGCDLPGMRVMCTLGNVSSDSWYDMQLICHTSALLDALPILKGGPSS